MIVVIASCTPGLQRLVSLVQEPVVQHFLSALSRDLEKKVCYIMKYYRENNVQQKI